MNATSLSACDRVVRWVIENGGHIRGLGVHESDDGQRGVYALTPVQRAQIVADIPRRCMVTLHTVLRYECGRAVMRRWPDASSKQIYLAVFLLEQKLRADSRWSAYLGSIPKKLGHLPLFYGKDDLQLLEGSTIPLIIARRRATYANEFSRVVDLAPQLACFSIEDYMRARATVMSRLFRVDVNGQQIQALIPFVDLLNHSQDPQMDWAFDGKGNAFVLRCTTFVATGAAVHDCYGRKSNTRFLQNYGFTMPDNPDDEATVLMKTPDWCADLHRRSLEFGAPDGKLRSFVLARRGSGRDGGAMSFLRLACARGREIQTALKSSVGLIPFLSKRNEREATRALSQVCREAVAKYRSTIEEDEELLSKPGLELNKRNCITVRRGEKAILLSCAELAR